jgi:hypothetical protein
LTWEPVSAGNAAVLGSCSITFHQYGIRGLAKRKQRPQSFSRFTDRNISYQVTAINFRTSPAASWAQIVSGVNVLVPGQLLTAPIPNHIVFNTESGEASWETSSQEWIPEDEAYDRLVVKFSRE